MIQIFVFSSGKIFVFILLLFSFFGNKGWDVRVGNEENYYFKRTRFSEDE